MPTLRLQHFARPEVLSSIEPRRLVALLETYSEYFAERGFALPARSNVTRLDCWELLKVLTAPDPRMPQRLLEALYIIDEMATPEAMDSILAQAFARGVRLDVGTDPTPADVAVEAWLHCRDILEHKHGERHLRRRRSFTYYQSPWRPPGEWKDPGTSRLTELEKSLDMWFASNNRGRGTRILTYQGDRMTWYMIRHGEALKREESLRAGEPDAVIYRPIRYDVVGFQPYLNELSVNARTPSEREMYRKQFGHHLFGDVQYFPGDAKYTLEPLRDQGAACLVCSDVDGIDWIKLREVHLYYGTRNHKTVILRASDLFEQLAEDNQELPDNVRLIAAVFRVKFTGHRNPRSVTIRPNNLAQYLRDDDAVLVERWLERRGFILKWWNQGEVGHELLAGA